jgi:hypothetical protein
MQPNLMIDQKKIAKSITIAYQEEGSCLNTRALVKG